MENKTNMDRCIAISREPSNTSMEISNTGVTAMGITAGIIGCWAVISMIAGSIHSGGLLDLLVNLFTAING